MIRLIMIVGLVGGGIVASGRLTAAQWHAIGAALLALTIAHGLTVLPWLLAALFAWRYWRWKRSAIFWRGTADRYLDSVVDLKGKVEDLRRPQRHKRATR